MPTTLEQRPGNGAHTRDLASPEVTVRVVTEDRTGRSDGPRDTARRPRRRGFFASAITAVLLGAIAVAAFLVIGAISGLLHFDPFSSTQVDRTPPVLLRQMHDLHQFRAARGTFEVNVDTEDDVNLVPAFIAGERTQFNGVGTVDANVDFSKLSSDAVVLGGDGSVTVTLPTPTYSKAVVDPARSHVMNRDRGLVDRLSGVFSDSPTSDKDLYVLAGKKMDAAARESTLLTKAQANTRAMLTGLLGKLGYADVHVVFTQPLTAAAADPATR
jgi:hypothetical protein